MNAPNTALGLAEAGGYFPGRRCSCLSLPLAVAVSVRQPSRSAATPAAATAASSLGPVGLRRRLGW